MADVKARRLEGDGLHLNRIPAKEYERNISRSPRSRPPTQTERVLRLIEDWRCGVDFLNPSDGGPPILRYTGRLHELRRAGYLIHRRPCESHDHDAQMWEWKLIALPQTPIEGERCPGCGSALSHTSTCTIQRVAKTEGRLFE